MCHKKPSRLVSALVPDTKAVQSHDVVCIEEEHLLTRLLISKLVHCYCQSVKGRKAKLAVCPPQWPLSLQEDRAGRENP